MSPLSYIQILIIWSFCGFYILVYYLFMQQHHTFRNYCDFIIYFNTCWISLLSLLLVSRFFLFLVFYFLYEPEFNCCGFIIPKHWVIWVPPWNISLSPWFNSSDLQNLLLYSPVFSVMTTTSDLFQISSWPWNQPVRNLPTGISHNSALIGAFGAPASLMGAFPLSAPTPFLLLLPLLCIKEKSQSLWCPQIHWHPLFKEWSLRPLSWVWTGPNNLSLLRRVLSVVCSFPNWVTKAKVASWALSWTPCST